MLPNRVCVAPVAGKRSARRRALCSPLTFLRLPLSEVISEVVGMKHRCLFAKDYWGRCTHSKTCCLDEIMIRRASACMQSEWLLKAVNMRSIPLEDFANEEFPPAERTSPHTKVSFSTYILRLSSIDLQMQTRARVVIEDPIVTALRLTGS